MRKIIPIIEVDDWLDLRRKHITSTESASLFGMQMPSMPTAFELWHIKRGLISGDVEANNYMIWGRIFQEAICEVIQVENPAWKISPFAVFASDGAMGSSFDYFILHPERGQCLLEIKMTTYREWKEKYIEDDDGEFIEVPDYYETQCQHQLEVIDDYEWICLAVAIVDTRQIKYIWRARDRGFGRAIRDRINSFIALEAPPPPDLEKDADLLARMHRANNTDAVYNGTEDAEFNIAAQAYLDENEKEKAAKKAKDRAKSQIILRMGQNNSAWGTAARVSNKSKFTVTKQGA